MSVCRLICLFVSKRWTRESDWAMDIISRGWNSSDAPYARTSIQVRIVSYDWVVRNAVARMVERLAAGATVELSDVIDPEGTALAGAGFISQPMVLVLHVRSASQERMSHRFSGPVILLADEDIGPIDAGDSAVLRRWRDEPIVLRDALDTAFTRVCAMQQGAIVAARPSGLTPRQGDVLDRLARGLSNAEIGQDLGMSENTVRIHVSAILKTLGLTNRTQAALWATRKDAPSAIA
jgi:DNA-binding CsgD family transcriptional regulator